MARWSAWSLLLGVGAAAAAAEPESAAGVVVLRRADAAEVVQRPVFLGSREGGRRCPPGVGDHAAHGSEIRLSVVPGKARRDEPGWSALLLEGERGRGELHLLFHGDRTYSTLHVPLALDLLWDEMRRGIVEAGEEEFYQLTPGGAVATVRERRDGVDVEQRRVTAVDGFHHRKDFELSLALHGDAELAAVAYALESAVQAIRSGGDDWLALTGAASGVPVALAIGEHLPDSVSRYAEELVSVERRPVAAGDLTVPAGYSRIPFVAGCF